MKRILLLVALIGLIGGACKVPTVLQPNPTDVSPLITVRDLELTATARANQAPELLFTPTLVPPTETVIPSGTPIVNTPTNTATVSVPTETPAPSATQIPASATTAVATAMVTTAAIPPTAVTYVGMVIVSNGTTTIPAITATSTGTAQPLIHGTMPPALPAGKITLLNLSKAEAYISLQCTTSDGYETIIEYPVKSKIRTNAPAGKYVYVLWVGGNKIVGNFTLDKSQELELVIYKDQVKIINLEQ